MEISIIKTNKKNLQFTGVLFLYLFVNQLFAQNNGDELFRQKCATCHTIGDGNLIGPDLYNVHLKRTEEWLKKFISSSTSFIKSGDPEAVQIFNTFNKTEMPDPKLNDEEMNAVLAYMKSTSSNKKDGATVENTPTLSTSNNTKVIEKDIPQPDQNIDPIQRGKQLFTGEYSFTNKGPSCLSCHQLTHDDLPAGGTLAKDLTLSYEKYNEKGVKGLILSPPFPVMKGAYMKHEISNDEAYYITMFLKNISKEKVFQHQKNYNKRFLYTGIFGVIILMGILPLIWYKKKNRVN